MNPIDRVATNVRKLREERDMTQGALAAKAGVTREYVVRLEAGRYDPALTTLDRLAKALRVKICDLVS